MCVKAPPQLVTKYCGRRKQLWGGRGLERESAWQALVLRFHKIHLLSGVSLNSFIFSAHRATVCECTADTGGVWRCAAVGAK